MYAAGSDTYDSVAGLNCGRIKDLGLVHDTGAVACDVVFVLCHHAGVLGGLAAYQCAASHYAAVSHALYDSGNLFGNYLADSDVVQEEQRLCATADDVVDAHCNCVDTDRIVLVHEHCELELSAYAVGAAYKYGFLHAGKVRHEQTSETSDAGNAAGGVGSCNMLLHESDGLVSGGYVYACCLIAFAETFHFTALSLRKRRRIRSTLI